MRSRLIVILLSVALLLPSCRKVDLVHPVESCPDEMIKTQQLTHDPEENKEEIKLPTIMDFVVMISKVYMAAAVDVLIEGCVIPWCFGKEPKAAPHNQQRDATALRAAPIMPTFTEEDCVVSLHIK